MPENEPLKPTEKLERSALLCSIGVFSMMTGFVISVTKVGDVISRPGVPWQAPFGMAMLIASVCLLMSGWLRLEHFREIKTLIPMIGKSGNESKE